MLKTWLLYFDRICDRPFVAQTTPSKITNASLSVLGESVLPVLMGDGGEDRAAADDDARADDEGRHLLGEVVTAFALEVVPGTVRLRTIHVKGGDGGGGVEGMRGEGAVGQVVVVCFARLEWRRAFNVRG